MNILIVSHEFPPLGGGGANACFFLAREFARQGHFVTVITSAYENLSKEEILEKVRLIRVKALRRNKEKSSFIEMLTYLFSAMRQAKALAKKECFDVCHVFFGIPSGPVGLALKRKYHIPYIVRFGGGDIPGAQKRFSGVYKILSPIIRSIWKNAAFLVANSEGLRERACAFERRYPIRIITNGVDSDFFTAKKREEKKEGEIRLLFVSRLIEGKGLQFIIPHLEEINKRLGGRLTLTIVGNGPYRCELERIAKESGAERFISFEGRKEKAELWEYYNQADVFILPSLSEGMPNVVLEAMAMGLPVIMTPCEGSAELIRENGLIVPIEHFVDAIVQLCGDEAECAKMGQAGERIAREDFDWGVKAGEYLALFSESRGNNGCVEFADM